MHEAGPVFLFSSLAASVGAVLAGLKAWSLADAVGRERWTRVSERALLSSFLLSLAATLLMLLLLNDRAFHIAYIYSYTSTTLPFAYTMSALWAGQEGSLLFWVFTLLLFGALLLHFHRRELRDMLPLVIVVIAATAAFFLFLLLKVSPPFKTIWEDGAPAGLMPPEGHGMNPLLQNPGMIVHPPLLFLGYVGFTIPFAYAMASLFAKRAGQEWLKITRRWSLISWLFLTLGILAGSKWAYVELGWGGYWAWDPVENASFIPWLTATAYIHSVMIEERRGLFRVWNVILVSLTFLLCIFGTFLTRSGIISSVHSFAGGSIGEYFAWFMGTVAVLAGGVISARWKLLRSEHHIESFWSREAAFLFNNVILLAMTFAVLWGTMYPVISEYMTGEKATVGPPFFNKVLLPLTLVLLLLTGLGPILAWRRADPKGMRNHLLVPGILSLVGGLILFAAGMRPLEAVLGFALALFVICVSILDHSIAAWIRRKKTGESLPTALWALLRRNGRRYGGYMVHVGVAVFFIGVLGSYYNLEKQATLATGDSVEVNGFVLKLVSLEEFQEPNRDGLRARLDVTRGGKPQGIVAPEISMFKGEEQQRASEVDIRSHLAGDLFVSLGSLDNKGRAIIEARWNPLMSWVWSGCMILIVGTIFALLPAPRKKRSVLETSKRAGAALGMLLVLFAGTPALADSAAATAMPVAPTAVEKSAEQIEAEESAFMAQCRELGQDYKCGCGCGMTVGDCDHTVCSHRDDVLARIASGLREGKSREDIRTALLREYGKALLMAPPNEGFDRIAWLAPYFGLGLAFIIGGTLLAGWLKAARVPAVTADPSSEETPAPEKPLDAADKKAVDEALEDYK